MWRKERNEQVKTFMSLKISKKFTRQEFWETRSFSVEKSRLQTIRFSSSQYSWKFVLSVNCIWLFKAETTDNSFELPNVCKVSCQFSREHSPTLVCAKIAKSVSLITATSKTVCQHIIVSRSLLSRSHYHLHSRAITIGCYKLRGLSEILSSCLTDRLPVHINQLSALAVNLFLSKMPVPAITLSNGQKIPIIGLGTWKVSLRKIIFSSHVITGQFSNLRSYQ